MAPTIIVGDDENAGDVAGELLKLADHQKHVRVRTDLGSPAFDVPDSLYRRYTGRKQRPEGERRVNAVDKMVADDDTRDAVTSDDDLPEGALNAEPADVEDVGGPIVGDELPEQARNIDPPANGEYPDSGATGRAEDGSAAEQRNSDDDARTGGDPDEQGEQGDSKPTRRTATKRAPRKAAKATPAAPATE